MDDLAKRKERTAAALALDRQKLLQRMPFIGGLLMRLDLVPVSDFRLDTAATDGDRIFVDIDFYAKLDAEERLFVLAHEAWHCALVHFARRQERDPKLFNAAADLEIHFVLMDEGLKAPFVLPHEPSWRGLSAEEIYERLQRKREDRQPGNGKEPENIKGRDGGGFDRHLDSGGRAETGNDGNADAANDGKTAKGIDPDYAPCVAPGAEERCRGRLVSAVQMFERMKGKVPARIAGRVATVLRPELNWRELLAQFVTSCYGGSRRWLPPARRHVWNGLYLQSQRSERMRAIVAVDTSGSTRDDLGKFLSQLTSLLASFGSYELRVIQCDAEVGKVESFDDANPIDPNREWETTGGGGTDFRPVFEHVENHPELDPNLLIFFTDGYGDCPERPPPYPVLWLLTEDGKDQPWGWNVRFKGAGSSRGFPRD